MIKFEYNLTSYEDLLRYFAKCLKLKVTDNFVQFTPDKGNGAIKLFNLPNGPQVMLLDFISYEGIDFIRKKSAKEFFVIRIDEAKEINGTTKSSLFFAKTSQEWTYTLSANTHLRQIKIIMSKKWLDEYFEQEDAGQILNNYITLKSPLVVYEILDAEYKRLMSEMMSLPAGKNFEQVILQNRVSFIIERFFTKLFKSIENENSNLRISSIELKRVKEVESELLKDFSQPPPAIAQLARVAAMSPSKLKVLFKEVFGYPVNQYYQRHRMNKAKAMLLSRKYSIRDTAGTLGFSSVSSFNKAFYKTFEQFPSDIAGAIHK
ncbi:helix-turn-helix transcriptional regulator [Panacibacter ginsenosidivorans]|uniref:Helix-turn-helix transcriptional regulator n=1 Tax=Panacibacter ginsenosidivorans TaxID=1813871 RepID=A0A5B8VD07_9BACT|nr:helix-turn-helix transcriptional regulator [Panacibacter ginsenosidivorans]QEC68873.1 helix-turn-helix transcriptional regulator [Panacibacter ginsenosidivorans]